MGEQTAISWCDHTKNLWWGCWKIADECKHCYADDTANRYAPGHWGREAPRKFFDDKNLNELLKWNRAAAKLGERRRVFVGSMMDWAEIHPVAEINARMDERRDAFWKLVPQCESLDFLMLTKRIENVGRLLPWMDATDPLGMRKVSSPWPNVWIGVTAGTRKTLHSNARLLRFVPAAVHFISCEPLLEHISAYDWDDAIGTLSDHAINCAWRRGVDCDCNYEMDLEPIDWLIVGNESGPKRRPAEMDWVRTARDAAARHGVAFHFKQWVEPNGKKIHLPMLDSKQHAEFPNG